MRLVFISSTFKDMQAERDALQNVVAPLLDNQISKYGEGLFFNDLRWGVNTSDLSSDEANKKILDVCLDEIDGCKPYMIVIVGERYGWIPEKTLIDTVARSKGISIDKSISVTELEIEYGALMRPEYKGKVLFYFRELDKTGMSDIDKKNYEAESSIHHQKIEELKNKIRKVCPGSIKTYKARWDRNRRCVTGLEGFCDLVRKDLEDLILGEVKKDSTLSWQEKTMKSARRYYEERAQNYLNIIGWDYVRGDGDCNISIYQGNYGSGKTTELARDFDELKPEIIKVPFVTGLDQYSSSSLNSLAALLYKMEEEVGVEHLEVSYEDCDIDSVIERINVLDKKVKKQYYLLVDNGDEELLSHLYSLFDEYNAKNVAQLNLFHKHNFHIQIAYSSSEKAIIVPPGFDSCILYTQHDIRDNKVEDYIFSVAKNKRKEVSEEVAHHIEKKVSSSSPLYSKLMFDRISNLDQEDFKAIDKLGGGMSAINKYLINLVDKIGDFTPDVVKELVKEATQRIDEDFVINYLGILAYTGAHVTYKEITYVFEKTGHEFSNVNFASVNKYLSSLINRHSSLNAFSIINQQAREAVIQAIEEIAGDTFVDDFASFILHEDISSIWHKYLIPALSNSHDAELLAKTLLHQYATSLRLPREEHLKIKRQLADIIFWYIEKYPHEYPAMIVRYLVELEPRIDWSFLFDRIPTVCVSGNLFDRIKRFLYEISDQISPKGLYGSTDPAVLSIYMKSIQKRAELFFLFNKEMIGYTLKASNEYSRYSYSLETRAKLDLIAYQGFCLNHVEAEDDDYRIDHLAVLYNEREFDHSDKRLYMTTVHKALCKMVAGRFEASTECNIDNGYRLIYEGVSDINQLNLYSPGIKENITTADIYLVIDSILYFVDDFQLSDDDFEYFIGVALRLVQFGIEEIDMRLSGLLTDIREVAAKHQSMVGGKDVYDALRSVSMQRLAISNSLSSRYCVVSTLNACAKISKYYFFNSFQNISREINSKKKYNYIDDFDLMFDSLVKSKWLFADEFHKLSYNLFFHIRALQQLDLQDHVDNIINSLLNIEIRMDDYSSFTHMCKVLLLIAEGSASDELVNQVIYAYNDMIYDPSYSFVRSEYRDVFNLVKQLYDL